MAIITLHRQNLEHNFHFLNQLLTSHDKSWGVVSKVLCGNALFLRELLSLGIREVLDSRISNLRAIKKIDPGIQTVYIKPPARRVLRSLVQFADVSFNTEIETIRMISREAARQNKIHKIIIMIELGDLREGVMGEDLTKFYSQVFRLPNIEIIGIGTNLNCLNGVMPSHDKLIQLSLYRELINARFGRTIRWASGGSSVTLPLLMRHQVPKGINHFRIGETRKYPRNLEGKRSFRALLDIGLLDVDPSNLIPADKAIEVSGASSDMIALDLGRNRKGYQVGDLIPFRLSYMGLLRVLNSAYIETRVV